MTLVEVVMSMGILFVAGLAVIGGILYTRHAMELNKQKLTALNYARQVLEAASTNSAPEETTGMLIMRFNDPGLDVPATVVHRYYPIETDGEIDWDNPTTAPLLSGPMYSQVSLSWNSMGSSGRQHSVTMSSFIRAGTQ